MDECNSAAFGMWCNTGSSTQQIWSCGIAGFCQDRVHEQYLWILRIGTVFYSNRRSYRDSPVGNVWVGRKWTYSYDMDDIPVDNDKIVLVYNETDRVKDKIVYYLCLGLVDGKVARVSVSKNKLPQLFRMYERFPRILVGNDPEYMYMYRNDMNALLDIKYRSN